MIIQSSTKEQSVQDIYKVTHAPNYKALYQAIQSEFKKNRTDEDMFFFIENLLCWMCPEISMCLDDDGTIEVFYGQGSFIAGEFKDLKKLVASEEFISVVLADDSERYAMLMTEIEKCLEWGDEGIEIVMHDRSNSL
ncbi:hypothetical protein C7A11_26485 [Pseudomonas simiae]|uniref:hypothetical protein n=1 Tax=Pseudomonas simiae TaxID=321846 RepID=UPI000D03B228|nr:hypothetical protein [Pseudomonas simiae]PRW84338.1 hypothetical protein C7A11_26485 [Pseudomonas simiae]